MKHFTNNPTTNVLGGGVTEEKLNIAVLKSGYPLQTRVAIALKDNFFVQEEWSFIDNQTDEVRTIDLLAEKHLFDKQQKVRVRPILNLIIECKQSELPYIFFLANEVRTLPNFPF